MMIPAKMALRVRVDVARRAQNRFEGTMPKIEVNENCSLTFNVLFHECAN